MNLFLIALSSPVIAFNTQISAETSPSDLLLRPLNFVAVPFSSYFLTKRYHRGKDLCNDTAGQSGYDCCIFFLLNIYFRTFDIFNLNLPDSATVSP